jgi:KDO2-lipid IV(A) lauroyltransferase
MRRAPLRHALEHALFLPFYGLVRLLPHAASRRLGERLGALAHALDRSHRRVALDNLAHALPELGADERRRLVAECFRHFGAFFADVMSARRFDLPAFCRRGEIEGLDHLRAAESAGRGSIFLSAHFGNWEVVPFYLTIAGAPLHVVGRSADNPHFDRTVRRLRERFGNRALDKRGAVREMFRVVRDRGRLGLLIDQRVRAEEGIEVEFFGRPALTSPIVARLAARSGAPIVPVFGDHRPGGRYRVEIRPPLWPEGGDDRAATHELTRRCLAVCEEVIRGAPARWLWMHRRWQR